MIPYIMLMVSMISMTPNVDVFQSEQPQISSNSTDTTVTDIDGNVYKTVRIGHQIWMAENLRTSRFRDGSEIANHQDRSLWNADTSGAWVNYDHDAANDSIYGKLYNFKAISNPAGVCPEGWVVPSNDEFLELIEHLGGNSVAGGKLKATGNLTDGTGLWRNPNGSATNQTGFSAIPGGEYYSVNDLFKDLGSYANFWTSSQGPNSFGSPTYYGYRIISAYGSMSQFTNYSTGGYSIRCKQEVAQPAILNETIIVRGTTKALVQSFLSVDVEHTPTEVGVIWGRSISASPLLTVQNADGRVQSSSPERGSHEVYISNLSPATDYQLRAYAFVVDTAGTSQAVYSDIIRITTLNPDSLSDPGMLMVQDIEGNDYPIVEINGVNWFAKNLYVSSYRDGTPIPGVTAETASEWASGGGKWVSVNYDSTHDATVGKLYNGQSVRWWRGVCPAGWIVPTKSELEGLRDFLGGYTTAGGPLKSTGTIQDGDGLWKAPNTGATNTTGFSAVPAGRYHSGQFERTTEFAYIWSRTINSDFQDYVNLYNSSTTFWMAYDRYWYYNSVRCMRSSPIEFPQTATVVTMPEPTTLTQTLAVLQGSATPDGEGEISEWGVVLATHSTPTIQDVKLDANDPIHRSLLRNMNHEQDSTGTTLNPQNEFLIVATGLSSGTEYYARSYAILNGAVHYGNTVTFSTLNGTTEPVVDRDGNKYATIQIGDQVWMAENLRVSRFQDGTAIQDITKLDGNLDRLTPGWVPYPDTTYEEVFGKLYTWGVVDDITMNICPEGWHVPTREEWGELLDHLFSIKTYDSRGRSTGIIDLQISDPGVLMAPGRFVWSEQLEADNQSGFSLMPSGAWLETSGFYFTPDKAMSNGMDLLTGLWINYRTGSPYKGSYYSVFNSSYDLSRSNYIGQMRGDGSQISARPIRCIQGKPTVGTEISIDHLKGTIAGIDIQSYHGYAYPQRRTLKIFEENEPGLYSSWPIYSEILSTPQHDNIYRINNNPQDKIIYNLDPDRAYIAVVKIEYKDPVIPTLSDTLEFTTSPSDTPLLVDISGNSYMTMQVGDRLWMAENLRTDGFNDGTGLFRVLTWDHQSRKIKWPHMKSYMVDLINPRSFGGGLYNRLAVRDVKGICPAGWSVPTIEEWRGLIDTFGGPQVAGPLLFGIDSESGFMTVPNGNIGITSSQIMRDDPRSAYFWTSSEDSVDQQRPSVPIILRLDNPICTNCSLISEIRVDNPAINRSWWGFDSSSFDAIGASVRCIRDIIVTSPEPEPVGVSDISQTGVTLRGALRYDGGGALSKWGIYLSLDPEPGPEDRVLTATVPEASESASQATSASDSLGAAQSFQITVDSLIPGAAYYARAFAENEVGTGVGDIVRFRTLVDITGVTVTDIDGNIYRTVQIGDQFWMKDNLRTSRYRNGDLIDHIPDSTDWASLTFLDEDETIGEGAWVHYRNDSENEIPFGKLYNWFAVTHPSGICPAGWQVPSREDWEILIEYAGGADIAGGNLKATGTLEAGTGLWLAPNEGATDSVGFSALPADFRWPDGKYSLTKGENAIFWTSTRDNEFYAYNTAMNRYFEYIDRPSSDFTFGFSVRCLRDDRSAPPLPDQPDSLQTDVAYQTPVDQQKGISAQVVSDVDTTTVLSVQVPPAATQQVQDGDGRPRDVGSLEITATTEQTVVELLGFRRQDEPSEDDKALLELIQNRISDLYKVEIYDQDDAPIEDPRFEKPATLCIQTQTSIDERIGGSDNVGFIRIETGPDGEHQLIEETFTSNPESQTDLCTETDGFSVFALVPIDLTKVSQTPFPRPKGRAPSFETPEATYIDSLYISIGVAEAGTIRYTLDGTQPNDTSEVYIDPILIKEPGSITIRAIAEHETYSTSEVVTATYTLRIQTLEIPSTLFPENETENVGILTEFEWSSINGADLYTLELMEGTPFSEPIRYEGLTANYLALTEPLKVNTIYVWRVRAENSVGGSDWSPYSTFATGLRTSNEVIPGPEIPDQVSLEQNYPNPFNPSTTIRFGLPAVSNVKLEIYNVLGQRVSTIAKGSMNAGWHQITFDGSHLSSGVYLYRLATGEGEMRVKMFTLIK